jgi:hypothetical protein
VDKFEDTKQTCERKKLKNNKIAITGSDGLIGKTIVSILEKKI